MSTPPSSTSRPTKSWMPWRSTNMAPRSWSMSATRWRGSSRPSTGCGCSRTCCADSRCHDEVVLDGDHARCGPRRLLRLALLGPRPHFAAKHDLAGLRLDLDAMRVDLRVALERFLDLVLHILARGRRPQLDDVRDPADSDQVADRALGGHLLVL